MGFCERRLAEIIHGLSTGETTPARGEKRRAERVVSRARVPMRITSDSPAREVVLRDFSARGVRFVHDSPLARYSQLLLNLPRPDGSIAEVVCTVVHCVALRDGGYSIGVEFAYLMDEKPDEQDQDAELARIRASILD